MLEKLKKYKDWQLCFVRDNFAYFTPDLNDEWGDDWDDSPYGCNAGFPYFKNGGLKVAFDFDALTYDCNVSRSAAEINDKKLSWFQAYDDSFSILAGTTFEDFAWIMAENGVRVYVDVSELTSFEEESVVVKTAASTIPDSDRCCERRKIGECSTDMWFRRALDAEVKLSEIVKIIEKKQE